jgi:hypothetical protein
LGIVEGIKGIIKAVSGRTRRTAVRRAVEGAAGRGNNLVSNKRISGGRRMMSHGK